MSREKTMNQVPVRRRFRSWASGLCGGLFLVALVAGGQARAEGDPAADGSVPAVKVERGADGKKVYRITEAIRIEGKIQKPEAFYVLQKSSIDYDWQELTQDFIPKIIESVSDAPF